MDRELEVIHNQMEETRASLADKLEALESQVRDTVQTASEAVSSTVGGVKEVVSSVSETVGNVSEKVTETVETVKEKVAETVETVADTFNIGKYVERAPWASMGVSVAVGFAAGQLLPSWDRLAGMAPSFPAATPSTPPDRAYGTPASGPSLSSEVTSTLGNVWQEISGPLQAMAVGTLMGVIREMVTRNVPGELANELSRVIDNVTTDLGGKKMEGHWLTEMLQGQHNGHHGEQGQGPSTQRQETFSPGANV